MTEHLPDPPVPADLDLRDFRWMKLDLIALFNSDFNATPDDTAWRAGVTLWGKAWHQIPAGSVPDDDATLCNLAGLGRDLRTWRRIKEVALRGFERCCDGRLYHGYVCRMALEAAEEKRKFEERRARDRERKKTGNSAGDDTGIPPEQKTASGGIPAETPGQGAGQGQGAEGESPSLRSGVSRAKPLTFVPPNWVPRKDWDDFVEMRRQIRKALTDTAAERIVQKLHRLKLQGGHDPGAVLNESIMNKWQGVFPLKNEGVRNGSSARDNGRNGQSSSGSFAATVAEAVDRRAGGELFDLGGAGDRGAGTGGDREPDRARALEYRPDHHQG